MKIPPIIIHVPKTGGTTLFMALSGAEKPPVANFLYRHVIMNDDNTDMRSNCGDIFESNASSAYYGKKIILMIRDPLDRLESEFGFLGNRDLFRNLWEHNTGLQFPTSFETFVSHPATSNSICKFLLGVGLYSNQQLDESDFDQIMHSLDSLDFVYGRTNEMGLTVQNVEHRCSLSIANGKELPRHRTSLFKPKRVDNWKAIEQEFESLNHFDIQLVDELSKRFQKQISELPSRRTIEFKGDVYDSIYLFLNGKELRSPLEIYANDLEDPEKIYVWVKNRKIELDKLVLRLMPEHQGDGKAFLNEWLAHSIPLFLESDCTLEIHAEDPLQTLRKLTEMLFA